MKKTTAADFPQHISVRSGVFWLAWMRQATCNTWRSPVFSFIPSAGILEASGCLGVG